MCDPLRRHKSRRHGRYDINGFITQLLASRRFDELAEKLAEKAANRIMNIRGEQTHVDRASDTESIQPKPQNQSEEKHEIGRVQLTKNFAGKINPEAIMNETILLTESLKLKYKYLKKNAEKKIKDQKELASKNVTNENQNMTIRLVDGEHTSENKTEKQIAELNATQQIQNRVITEPVDENKRIKDYNEEQEPNHVENVIREDNPSSLDEQNQQYVPSAEKTITEVDEEKTQKHARKESSEFGNAIAYFRGRENSAEENKVPLESHKPSPDDVIDKSVVSNERNNGGSQEQAPEDERSREITDDEPVQPVIRKEGGKVYTYVQDPEYKDYHEEMAKWQKEHPESPADFL